MTRRNERLDHLLSSEAEVKRLRGLWSRFQKRLAAIPRDQACLNRLRAQMPPGGLSWPLWSVVLRDPAEQEAAA